MTAIEKPAPVPVDHETLVRAVAETLEKRKRAVTDGEYALRCAEAASLLSPGRWHLGTRRIEIEGRQISVFDGEQRVAAITEPDLVNLILSIVQRQLLGIAELERG